MWDRFKKILGYTWAAPVTFFGLTYSSVFWAFRWHKWHGVEGDALVWTVDSDRAPKWLNGLWTKWGGHTIGNVIVLKNPPREGTSLLVHEQQHVLQCMRLGIFQPLLYGMNMLAIKIGCPSSHPYFDCPFEIDARRAAGEPVDVVGLINKSKKS
jgi:hypothetical protein